MFPLSGKVPLQHPSLPPSFFLNPSPPHAYFLSLFTRETLFFPIRFTCPSYSKNQLKLSALLLCSFKTFHLHYSTFQTGFLISLTLSGWRGFWRAGIKCFTPSISFGTGQILSQPWVRDVKMNFLTGLARDSMRWGLWDWVSNGKALSGC